MRSLGKAWNEIKNRVVGNLHKDNKELLEKALSSPKGSNERFLLDQIIADTWIEELGELIEYVKYQ